MFPFTNNGGYWLSLGLSPLCSDSSSGSEEEAGPGDDMSAMEHWMSRPSQLGPAHLGSTSSSSSSTQSGGSGNAGRLADSLAHAHISHLAHTHLAHTHLGHHQQSHLSQSHHGKGTTFLSQSWLLSLLSGHQVLANKSSTHTHTCLPAGIGHLSLKRKGALSVAENGGSLRRSCEFGSDMLWPPPLESEGQSYFRGPNMTRNSPDFSRESGHADNDLITSDSFQ